MKGEKEPTGLAASTIHSAPGRKVIKGMNPGNSGSITIHTSSVPARSLPGATGQGRADLQPSTDYLALDLQFDKGPSIMFVGK